MALVRPSRPHVHVRVDGMIREQELVNMVQFIVADTSYEQARRLRDFTWRLEHGEDVCEADKGKLRGFLKKPGMGVRKFRRLFDEHAMQLSAASISHQLLTLAIPNAKALLKRLGKGYVFGLHDGKRRVYTCALDDMARDFPKNSWAALEGHETEAEDEDEVAAAATDADPATQAAQIWAMAPAFTPSTASLQGRAAGGAAGWGEEGDHGAWAAGYGGWQ